ncbi:2-hydroxycyclohexanecarboxyl-CoA dehydrogenase [Planobispora rosea]|uniref:2-hydroxycyclohexanecarboxyl-CoA dehydrogenase n=1 Tax=Planobispora rosea TaxID=35762 RepID=A0A8J3WC16_PLARO|nr:SDR family NAD(P)-dependent oxidoreductase [Planobispora rosea]GGS45732.1 2-hydroxycyclohexanecarboxyl-CoA dehydrogenase [Planobispora rosea]GIH82441.1 2-hydroxycyclohexanecarboxyl-CoA dehydrogenase [Planobispora rosea]
MRGLNLDGRTAVVTGGAGAIGAAICGDLASLGARVVVADIDEPAAARIAASLDGAAHLAVDLADPASIEAFCAWTGPVDILVHNAGVSIVEPFVTSDPENWDLMWRVNLRAPMLLTKLLLPGMVERGWGRLVFISSDGARAGSGGEGAYAATKAGLFGLAKTLAREAARGSVTSNVVCPGPTDTPMLRRVDAEKPGLVDKIARGIPLRRLGTPEDVAGLVAYLCTDRAAYVTGQVLSVSGGVTMH